MVRHVRIGFVVEGDSEKIILEHSTFREWATQHGMHICDPIINMEGKRKIFNKEIMNEKIAACRNQTNPDKVVLLFDLDEVPCYTAARNKIDPDIFDLIVMARKAFEAWFLADGETLGKALGIPIQERHPETISKPWEYIKQLSNQPRAHGPGDSKPKFARKMLKAGFSIQRAAEHPHCPSARYFVEKLQQLQEAAP